MSRRLVYDCETDGFLSELTRIHCISIRDVDTKQEWSFADHRQTDRYPDIPAALDMLSKADEISAHNGIEFDSQAILKCYPTWTHKRHVDTQTLSRAWFPNIKESDFKLFRRKQFPAHLLMKPHSLEAWGYRLGHRKADFDGPWDHWTLEMHEYMRQDTVVLLDLYMYLEAQKIPMMVAETELEVTDYLAAQHVNGFKFDVEAAVKLYATLQPIRQELDEGLKAKFSFWYAADGKAKTPKRSARYKREHLTVDARETFTAGAEYQPIKQTFFNPSSRQHIAHVLQKVYGWKPQEFTDNGQPEVTDDIVSSLPYAEAPMITRYLLHDKRIGQLAEGKNAWLKLVDKDGFMHGSVNQSGAITHRATHSHPNMTQVPSVQVGPDKHPLRMEAGAYGWEARSLFIAPSGWKLVGADASGLELRCLAHFMAKYDGGAYIDAILNGDIHTLNWEAGKPWLTSRAMAKTFIYAFLYGAGDWKLGHTCRPNASEEEKEQIGRKLRSNFLKNVPALGSLVSAVEERTSKGYFILPTGHVVYVRKKHAALNSLLQGTGAVICKRWLFHLSRELKAQGLRRGWDGDYTPCVWAHDEAQNAVRDRHGLPERFGQLAVSLFPRIQAELKFRCPLAGEYKIGRNWAETH